MSGLLRAEWIRLRKRRSIQAIVLAVPLLIAVQFAAGYLSIGEPPPFDEAAVRAELISQGYGVGLPPDEAEAILALQVSAKRQEHEFRAEEAAIARAAYAFPRSLVTVLGSSLFVLLALILLTASAVGDEFGWGTIRTSLIAFGNRRRVLAVRIVAVGAVGLVLFGLVLVLGAALPVVLSSGSARPPAQLPAVDWTGIGALLLGNVVAAATVIGFSAFATVLARSGSLALVGALIYFVIEAAILSVLVRLEPLQEGSGATWLLNGFPLRGFVTLSDVATKAASGLGHFPGEVLGRDLGPAAFPIVALAAWALLFGALAFRRFGRMDIVE
ncbi:MAG TPA: ABC transporter permease subunit [Candidatus Deferrimicrobiaceae bacterium]|nr:ABC transporter permease subunit [Candidatus Deferrimicrobiaceae bacterium]